MGTVSGGGLKNVGSNVTIVATPKPGYRFVGWYEEETLISTQASYSFVIGNLDLSYVAKFAKESYNLIIQTESNEKGAVSDSSGSYEYQDNITISASANEGYTFSGWYEGSTLVSSSNPYSFSMPHGDKTYVAKFSANSYYVTLTNANTDKGSISGSGTYLYGSNVTIRAYPKTGAAFLGWYDENGTLVSSLATFSFSMPHEGLTYTAKFDWAQYTVSTSANDVQMGSVTGGGAFIYGQQVTLVASPNEHHSFLGWYEDNNLVSQDSTYSFSMPARDASFEARFVHNYSLNLYSDDESRGSVSGPSEWGAGLEVTVTANALPGFVIDYWYDEDFNEVSYDAEYTFIMPEKDIELSACFDVGYTLTVTSSDPLKGTTYGSGVYKAGSDVTVGVTYHYGRYKGLFDNASNLLSDTYTYSFTMPANDFTVIARFMTQEEEDQEAWDYAHGVIPSFDPDNMTVTYGMYPQNRVTDSSTLTALNALEASGTNDWYWYEGEYYAKVNGNPYGTGACKFDDETLIVRDELYWFRCDPITWNVLSVDGNHYFLVSSKLLACHCYYGLESSRTIDGKTVYANNYMHSDIRAWLNEEFYDTAFALGNSNIEITEVDNSSSTLVSGAYTYACANTNDKIFLLSYKEILRYFSKDTRGAKTTEWARATGAHASYSYNSSFLNGYCRTRSPSSGGPQFVSIVRATEDNALVENSCTNKGHSIRPAMHIEIPQ